MQYLGDWVTTANSTDSGDLTMLSNRPAPVGMLFDNTTATGSWLYGDQPLLWRDSNRTVNNVTMAMPHGGLYAIAMDTLSGYEAKHNGIAETQVYIDAQVPSPTINVLCAEMTADELAPLIWLEWPENKKNDSISSNHIPGNYWDSILPGWSPGNTSREGWVGWRNKTVVDDLFSFGDHRIPPVFPKLPMMYNTVLNYSSVWHTDTIYILAAGNASNQTVYSMCSLSFSTEAGCSTNLKIETQGGKISTDCGADNEFAYTSSAASGVRSQNWPFVAQTWATALSFGTGISDGMSSNARLLSQLIPSSASVSTTMPTIAEALAVLAGCTALISSVGAPFNQDWTENPDAVPTDLFANPEQQGFPASIRMASFQSGATMHWQQAFSIVLIAVFLMSAFCLFYFAHLTRVGGGLVNDFMDFQNMFSLALHSPADRRLAGTASSGPERHHMREPWFIREDWNHQVFIGDGVRKRGHTSWMSHARQDPPPRQGRRSTMPPPSPSPDIEFDNLEAKPPEAYKPTIGDGLKRKLGGLGLAFKKN
jgi:hypothetical protein